MNSTQSARGTWWRQFSQLYLVALIFTLVPFLGAWGYARVQQRLVTNMTEQSIARADSLLTYGSMMDATYELDMLMYSDTANEAANAIRANALIEQYWVTLDDYDLTNAEAAVAKLETSSIADAHTARGNLALVNGDTTGAVRHFEQAIATDANDAYAHHQLGFALNGIGQYQDALGHFTKALELAPGMAWVQSNLQFTLTALRRCEEPVAGVEQAVRAACHNQIGIESYNAGSYTEAGDHFARAVEAAPDSALYSANLASALYGLEQYESARTHALTAFDLGLRDHWILQALEIY